MVLDPVEDQQIFGNVPMAGPVSYSVPESSLIKIDGI